MTSGYTGARVRRLEDPRLLQGRGRFVEDLVLPRMLRLAFVRSPYAHAEVARVETDGALALPGVVAVLTAADLRDEVRPLRPRLSGGGFTPTAWPALAGERVQFAGQAVAAVVAENAYVAADARERVQVAYRPLDPVTSLEAGLAQGQVLFRRAGQHGDVAAAFARAAAVVRETFSHGRCAPAPLEGRGVAAEWDGATLTVWASTQAPAMVRTALAAALGLGEAQVRVVVPDVGGGFGLKLHVLPEDLVVAAVARRLGRPVKWVEERREQLAVGPHARAGQVEAELALDARGRILALRVRVVSDAGAYHVYPFTQALEPLGTAAILPGPYRVGAYAWEAVAVATHKPPLGAYRGVGMAMGAFVMERLLDLGAEQLGLDPVEIRRRNLVDAEAYPFAAASGLTYDSGDLPAALERALELADWPALVREREAARTAGRRVGLGVACYTEYTGMGAEVFRRRGMDEVPGTEAGTVRIEPDGTVTCRLSFPSQGQGHATAAAQLVADRLGVPLEHVRMAPVDLAAVPPGSGTFGSRGAVSLLGTVAVAADRLRERLRVLAALLLEAAPEDVVLADGRAAVRGAPHRTVSVAELARASRTLPAGGLPSELAAGLEATVHFDPPGATFSGAAHVAMVEVDPETGSVRVLRYAVVEDCGPVINPLLVEGQVHGAICQGFGEALLERVAYDGHGTPLTATLMDYALPRADDLPAPRLDHVVAPARWMPGGVKGMGEGGTIGAPAALANAVADAVRPRGRRVVSLPIRPEDLVET